MKYGAAFYFYCKMQQRCCTGNSLASSYIVCVDTTSRIKVAKPVIDLDGDEMTRIIWAWIKEKVCADDLYNL